jgi:copper chaperone
MTDTEGEAKMTTETYTIPSISCSHCVHTIKMEVGELAGVQSVEADAQTKQATITFEAPATDASIRSLLAEIDYPVAD